jgi:hypothetical protein
VAKGGVSTFGVFCESEMPIFYCAGGEKRWQKSGMFITKKLRSDAGPNAVWGRPARPVSSSCCRDARARVSHRRVWSLAGPAHPVRRPEGLQIARSIRRGARLVTIDRTRPIVSGPLLDSNRMPDVARPVC